MKTIIYFLVLFAVSIQAQPYSTIKNITEPNHGETGVYYKDLDDNLNNFEGAYSYSNNGIYLKIVLQKKEQSSMNGYYFQDMLIGGYQLKINNIEITNTLNDINNNFANGIKHIISSGQIIKGGGYGFCEECPKTEYWVFLHIKDATTGKSCEMRVRKMIINGQEAIKILISKAMETRIDGSPPPTPISLPLHEELILIKQP